MHGRKSRTLRICLENFYWRISCGVQHSNFCNHLKFFNHHRWLSSIFMVGNTRRVVMLYIPTGEDVHACHSFKLKLVSCLIRDNRFAGSCRQRRKFEKMFPLRRRRCLAFVQSTTTAVIPFYQFAHSACPPSSDDGAFFVGYVLPGWSSIRPSCSIRTVDGTVWPFYLSRVNVSHRRISDRRCLRVDVLRRAILL